MAPQKKVGKEDPGQLKDKQALLKAEAELLSLRRLLELKAYEALDARRREHNWRERAEAAEAALEQAKLDAADIKADMARQHCATQEHLSQRAAELEARQEQVQSQLDTLQAENTALAQASDRMAQANQEQALSHQQHVESLQLEFAAMLKDTLGKMHARLEEQHTITMTGPAKSQTAAARAGDDCSTHDPFVPRSSNDRKNLPHHVGIG
eukprot:GHRR01015967.1.p1 GENE.GHRR01015967.1~~GHRR01015967.1.p1  ORF type:complete len:210 (+),score=78.58 GHRR01015967.1:459-1088(+)